MIFSSTSSNISLADLTSLHINWKQNLARIISPNSSKRKLRPDSLRVLKLFDHWLMEVPPSREQSRIGTELLQQMHVPRHHSEVQLLVLWKILPYRFWHFVNSLGPQYATQHWWPLLFLVFEFRYAWATTLGRKAQTTNYDSSTMSLCRDPSCLASTTGIELCESYSRSRQYYCGWSEPMGFLTPIPHGFLTFLFGGVWAITIIPDSFNLGCWCHLVKWFDLKCDRIQPGSTVKQTIQQMKRECVSVGCFCVLFYLFAGLFAASRFISLRNESPGRTFNVLVHCVLQDLLWRRCCNEPHESNDRAMTCSCNLLRNVHPSFLATARTPEDDQPSGR